MHFKVTVELLQTQAKGEELAAELEKIATKLDRLHLRSKVGMVAGSSAAIAGTVLSVTGGILSLFTFGASLILVIVGASVAAAGGIAASGATIAEKVISKKTLKRVDTLYKEYHDDPFVADLLGIDHISNDGSKNDGFDAKTGAQIALALGRAGRLADFVADTSSTTFSAFRVATAAGRAFVITGLVLDSVLLPMTIYDLVTASLELHRKNGHPAGQEVRNYIELINSIDSAITRTTVLPIDSTNDMKKPGGLKNANFNGSFRFV